MRIVFIFTVFLLAMAETSTFNGRDVQGSIKDFKTKNLIGEVSLKLVDTISKQSYLAETDDNGYFLIKNVIPSSSYKLDILDKDYMSEGFPVNIDGGKTAPYTLSPFFAHLKVSWMFNWGAKGKQEHFWSHLLAKIILIIYGICLFFVFIYSILQLLLSIAYAKNRTNVINAKPIPYDANNTAKVTVQLPMYNEMYVAERIIDTVAKFDYPYDKLEIQVLDDSTDETTEIIAKKVAEVKAKGINIKHIHRTDRTGYKAGALDAAMGEVEGEFIAIFDSDFVPEPDWLQKTVPYFSNDKVGVVQSRWGHLNKSYSLLTELQAFGLNGHFAVEQGGRSAAGHYINFNGTGGLWRKTCIADAGGWEHDTLTEDLDLSYRAQMRGWKFVYRENVIAPAELPITVSALKAQQHRWMKGGAECFRKMWKRVLFAKNVKIGDKIHGLAHLFNSSLFIFILLLSLLSLPVLHIKDSFSDLNVFIKYGVVFILSTVFLMYYYWLGYRDKTANTFTSMIRFIGRFFQFLIVSMGLSLNNTVAVLEGYAGIKSSFVRTPKFNVSAVGEGKKNKYDKKKISPLLIMEFGLFLLFGFTAFNRAYYGDLGMVPFHAMLAIGYGLIVYYSIREMFGKI